MVRNQQTEWTGAPQKRFAWAIGFVLALTMLYLVVLNNVIGPINLIVCAACLTLLFFETAFGICIGCKVYNLFNRDQARLCPGGVCEVPPAKNAGGNLMQGVIVALFALAVGGIAQWVYSTGTQNRVQARPLASTAPAAPVDAAEAERCKVPDFAKAMGHEEKWKLHNNCK
jgi:membrane-associated protease RseP (regulator of RpoE activity)